MSLVQSAYQSLLANFRDWKKLSNADKLELMQHATSLMGTSFRQALHLIEKQSKSISIQDFDMFYVVEIGFEKWIIFKSNSRSKPNDCSCKQSWLRKVGVQAPYMCMHQILLQLVLYVFSQTIPIQSIELEGSTQLAALLDFLP